MELRKTCYQRIDIPFDQEFTIDQFQSFLIQNQEDLTKNFSNTNPKILSFSFWEDSYYGDSSCGINFTIERDKTSGEIAQEVKMHERKAARALKAKQARDLKKKTNETEELALYNKLRKKFEK